MDLWGCQVTQRVTFIFCLKESEEETADGPRLWELCTEAQKEKHFPSTEMLVSVCVPFRLAKLWGGGGEDRVGWMGDHCYCGQSHLLHLSVRRCSP